MEFRRQLSRPGWAWCLVVVLGLGVLSTAPAVAAPTASSSGMPGTVSRLSAVSPTPGALVSVTPTRLLDNRTGNGAPRARVAPGHSLTVQFAGRSPIPSSGVTAVVAAVTAIAPTAAGFLTAAPAGSSAVATILNFTKNAGITNTAILPLSTGGAVTFTNRGVATIDLAADVTGYFPGISAASAGGTLATVKPTRLLDNRVGNGVPRAHIGAGKSVTVQFAGRSPIPASGAASVVAAVTVVSPVTAGYLTATPAGVKAAATIANFVKNTGVTDTAVLKLGTGGKVTFTNNSAGDIDLAADVTGYFRAGTVSAAGALVSTTPTRLLDTRFGNGAPVSRVGPGKTITLVFAGRGPIPNSGAQAVVVAVTAIAPTAAGFLSAGALGSTARATIANFGKNTAVTATAILPLGLHGAVTLTNNGGATIDLAADVVGYVRAPVAPTVPLTWSAPTRVTGNGLGHVVGESCPITTFCLLAGQNDASTFDGSTWAAPTAYPFGFPVSAISCSSATFCAAVSPFGYAATFDGTSWTAGSLVDAAGDGSGRALTAISCTPGNFCAALDTAGHAVTHSATGWSAPLSALPAGQPSAVSCTSRTFCLALNADGVSAQYDGTSWTRIGSDPEAATALSCSSPTFCVRVGGHVAELWNGVWLPTSVVDTENLTGVSCPAAGSCLAVDDTGATFALSGGVWTETATEIPPAGGTFVGCASATVCMLADTAGFAAPWPPSDPPTAPVAVDGQGALSGLSCPTASFCGAVDADGEATLRNGSSWTAPQLVLPTTRAGAVISCPTAAFCMAAGGDGSVAAYSGTTWGQPAVVDAGAGGVALSCPGRTFCALVDAAGRASTFDGNQSSWSTPVPLATDGAGVTAVSCASSTRCTALDDSGRAYTWQGSAWTGPVSVTSAAVVPGTAFSVSCPTQNYCLAADVTGRTFVEADGIWAEGTDLDPDDALGANVVSCAAEGSCIDADAAGNVFFFNGVTWSAPRVVDSVGLTSLSCPSVAFCAAGDSLGGVLTAH